MDAFNNSIYFLFLVKFLGMCRVSEYICKKFAKKRKQFKTLQGYQPV